MSTAHPPQIEVKLSTGKKVRVRSWTMAQRHECRPKIVKLLGEFAKIDLSADPTSLGSAIMPLFVRAEDEVVEIVRDSIPLTELSEEEWNEIAWTSDIPELAQAIWTLNVAGSGSIVGKLVGGLAGQITARRAAASQAAAAGNGSSNLTAMRPTTSTPGDSRSYPDAGEPSPSA